ncbi:MAG TPA: hypothetical protein VK993_02500 [Chthoniobacterales bacterium]|nr:hypothetical protein [Chthoniobacterales bacterium]
MLSIYKAPEYAAFAARWLGDIVLSPFPLGAGLVVGFLFAALTGTAIRLSLASGRWQPHYPFAAVGIHTLVSGLVAGAGRLALGPDAPLHFRYAPYTAFFYVAVSGLAGSIYGQIREHERAAAWWRRTCGVAALLLLVLGVSAFRREEALLAKTESERRHRALVLRWSNVLRANPEFRLLSPYENTAATITTLAKHDLLRPRLVPEQLARAVSTAPPPADGSTGVLEQVGYRPESNELAVRGWARKRTQLVRADCVVLGYETPDGAWMPWTVLDTGTRRRDIAERFGGGKIAPAGFKHTISGRTLPARELTFRAWSVDEQSGDAWPMAGAVRLTIGPP